MTMLAFVSIGLAVVAIFSLGSLHILSPEFQASWRMISEYATGNYKWILTLFFISWGLSTMLNGFMLFSSVTTVWAKIGVILILLSGTGAIMGGLFDINHRLHGLSFSLGVPTLIVGSLMVAYSLVKLPGWGQHNMMVLTSAHMIWISCLLMAISMAVMFAGFKKSGIDWGPEAKPPTEVPAGVIALGGYANRLLVVSYLAWNLIMGWLYLKLV
jgi:hypothetical protein